LPTHKRTTPKVFKRAKELRRNQTEAEVKLWSCLRNHQINRVGFRRQHAIGNYIADFCAPRRKLIIELDGSQHLEQKEYDTERTKFLESRGYKVLRFLNNEVLNNLDGVIREIQLTLEDIEKSYISQTIPTSLAPFFQEYNLAQLRIEQDASTIIERTLRYGTRFELRWLFSVYSSDQIKEWLEKWGKYGLPEPHYSFWKLILKMETNL
jgi:very-short-patch-repair endonuclease